MKGMIDKLDQFLMKTVQLKTEQYRIYIENGEVSAKMHDAELMDTVLNDAGALAGFTPAGVKTDFYMSNEFNLSLHVKSYSGDYDRLIRLLVAWLYQQFKGNSLSFVMEQNDNRTVDIWFDLPVLEGTRGNEEEGMHTC